MAKVFGSINDYFHIKNDGSRIVVSYDKENIDGIHATWHEVYIYKKMFPVPTLRLLKSAIYDDINNRVKNRILHDLKHVDDENTVRNVWLSDELQRNVQKIHSVVNTKGGESILPVRLKVAEDEFGCACYKTLKSVNDVNNFQNDITRHICSCLEWGYNKRDGIECRPYEELFLELDLTYASWIKSLQ